MSTTNSNEASGGGPHTHGQVNSAAPGIIHSNSDTFLNYLEKNRRSLKKRVSGNALEKKSVDAELELIEKMRKHYLLSQTNTSSSLNAKMSPSSSHGQDQQGVSFSEALHRQQQELLERVADLIYFSKLAHMGRIQSDPLAKFYEDNLLAERKPYCEMTYGQERNALRDQLEAGILENESDLWVQLTSVEKSVLSDTIQPQILELDEQDEEEEEQMGYAKQIDSSNIAGDHSAVEEEDEQFASKQLSKNDGQDGENDVDCSLQFIHAQHQKNLAMESSINSNVKGHCNPQQHQQQTQQQLPILGHTYSQNYDGDSEKSHTENEIDMIHDRSKGKNILNSGGNGNNGNNTVLSQQQYQQQLLKKAETDQAQYLSESQLQEQNQQQSQNAVKGFRRYKQNRYREERFAYQKKTKLQEIIKEEVPRQKDAYESDQCQSVDVGTQMLSIEGQKQQQQRKEDLSNTSNNCNNNNDNDEDEEEDESSAAHSANQINNNDSNNSANNTNNNNNNNNNNSLISGIVNANVTHTKKHHGQNKTRHNPCRNDNQYETDREKEQEGSKKMLSTGQAKKTQVTQQQQQQQHIQDSPQ